MNQSPKIKPHLVFSKEIDSSHSLKKSYTKGYKHLFKLKITKTSKHDEHAHRNQKHHMFNKLSPFLKSLKHLDLSQYSLEEWTLSQIKLIVKKFHRISRFSRLGNEIWTKSLLLSRIILKQARNLESLSVKAKFGHSSKQFLRLISLSKLKTLYLAPFASPTFEYGSLLNFSKYYPPSVEELSLLWEDEVQMLAERQYSFSINHLCHLQKLVLAMPLPVEVFKRIVQSIADPSGLKSLQFDLLKEENESYEAEIAELLNRFENLEELNIKSEMDIYPENNSIMKLKKLNIEQAVESTEELLRLGGFIIKQKDSLESLTLASNLWQVGMKVWFLEFLKEMKSLKKLKKLNLNLKFYMESTQTRTLFGLITELIEGLDCLEEIDFLGLPTDFKESDCLGFCKALEKHSGSLKSLKISLNGLGLDQKNSEILTGTLKLLTKLEDLALHHVRIEDPDFFIAFKEVVCYKNRDLNSVILTGIKRREQMEDCENVIKMLKGIISKPTMKNFCYVEEWKGYLSSNYELCETLKLSDVLREVYHFDSLKIPSETSAFAFNLWNLDSMKWIWGFGG